MSVKYKFAALLTLVSSAALIAACSSSTSSSSGRGQIPTGQYTGNLNGQVGSNNSAAVPTSTRIILNVVAQLETSESPGTISGISGNMVVTGGDRCWSGGTINGSSGGGVNPGDPGDPGDPDDGDDNNETTAFDATMSNGTIASVSEISGQNDQTVPQHSSSSTLTPGDFIIEVLISQAHAQSVINGNQMTLEIGTIQGTLNMTGRVTDDSYSGTFSTDNSDCGPISGGFDLDRV